MRMNADRIIVLISIVFGAGYFYQTGQITMLDFGDPIGPRLFPYVVGGLFVIGAILLLIETRASAAPGPEAPVANSPATGDPGGQGAPSRVFWMMAAVVAWCLLYISAFERAGYVLSTVLFLVGLTFYFHPRKWTTNIAISLLVPAAVYFIFHRLLHVNLPAGLLSF